MLAWAGWGGLLAPTVRVIVTIEASGSKGNGEDRRYGEHQVFSVGRLIGDDGTG